MSRTDRLKLAYFAVLACLGAAAVWLVKSVHPSPWILAFVALLLLVPGRVQGAYWRDFFRGRKLLADNDAAGSIPHFERFLSELRARPWLKHLIWLSWGTYSRDIEVMTRNNLGAAHMALGNFGAAVDSLNAASTLDPLNPLPYFNLALIEQVNGNPNEAAELLERARALGFRNTTADTLLRQAGELLARIEGHGATGSRS